MTDNELLTIEDRVRLLVNAIADDRDHPPVLKLFTPDGTATWLISEVDPDDPDRLFGLCDPGLGFPELGRIRRVLGELVPPGLEAAFSSLSNRWVDPVRALALILAITSFLPMVRPPFNRPDASFHGAEAELASRVLLFAGLEHSFANA